MKLDRLRIRKSDTRRRLEGSLENLSNFGFIWSWDTDEDGNYDIVLSGSNEEYDIKLKLSELRVFLTVFDYVIDYPTTITSAQAKLEYFHESIREMLAKEDDDG